MPLRRKKQSGLNIGEFSTPFVKASGGAPKSHSGFSMAPNKAIPNSKHGALFGNIAAPYQKRTIILISCLIVFCLILSLSVGIFVYRQTVRNALKTELDTQALSSVLTAPEDAITPYWILVAKTDASSAEVGRGTLTELLLVYEDPDNISMTTLTIEPNTRVYINGYGYCTLAQSFDIGQEEALTEAVARLSSIDVAHYIEFNEAGFKHLSSQLGVSDLDSQDFDDVFALLVIKITGSSSEQIYTRASLFESCAASDMDSSGFAEIFLALQGFVGESELYSAQAPANEKTIDGTDYSIIDSEAWNTMIARVESGLTPVATRKERANNKKIRKTTLVTVWNGVGVSGAAAGCSKIIDAKGWSIENVGNAAQFVYEETLVVYKFNKDENAAELMVSDLGQGRVVRSAARYSFDGDILVVIGKNYQPR